MPRRFPNSLAVLGLLLAACQPTRAQAIPSQPYIWKPVTITAGGFITGIVFSLKEPGLAYCRTDIGGAYRFDARQKQWTCLTDWVGPRNSNLVGCESLALDPTDANKIYLALGTYNRGEAAIARSADRGKTFQLTTLPLRMGANEDGRGMGERLAVDPSDPRVLYFGSRSAGLWRTTDSAVTWAKVDTFPLAGAGGPGAPGLPFVIFDPRATDKPGTATQSIFVGATGGASSLYHSADGGHTWSPIPAGPPTTLLPHRAALDPDQHLLYITYGNGPGPNNVTAGAVEKLDIDTNAWTDITPNYPGNGGFGGVALDRLHPATLMLTTIDHWSPSDAIFRSTDAGKTWQPINPRTDRNPAASPYIADLLRGHAFDWWLAALAIDPFDSNHVLYGTGATIWGTHNAADFDAGKRITFSIEAAGIEETAVLALASPPWGPAHLLSGVGDIGGFTHTDFALSPTEHHQNPGFTNTTSMEFAARKPVVVRTGTANRNNGTAAYSEDGGLTWQPISLPGAASTSAGARGLGAQAGAYLTVSADGTTLLTSAGGRVSISKDKGATWTPSQGLINAARPIADRVAPATFYALDPANAQIHISTDGGATFTALPVAGLPAPGGGRGANPRLVASFATEGELWVLAGGSLYRSTNMGLGFEPIPAAMTINNFALGKPAPDHSNPAIFVSAAPGGILALYRSDDLGKTWVRINDDARQFGGTPTVITADPRVYGRLYIGMNGRGILYGDLAQ